MSMFLSSYFRRELLLLPPFERWPRPDPFAALPPFSQTPRSQLWLPEDCTRAPWCCAWSPIPSIWWSKQAHHPWACLCQPQPQLHTFSGLQYHQFQQQKKIKQGRIKRIRSQGTAATTATSIEDRTGNKCTCGYVSNVPWSPHNLCVCRLRTRTRPFISSGSSWPLSVSVLSLPCCFILVCFLLLSSMQSLLPLCLWCCSSCGLFSFGRHASLWLLRNVAVSQFALSQRKLIQRES